tara:strand:- start:186 stop:1250 length:1065 start_codon:yes stop_codon:yes gene_type:complete
MTQLYSVLRPLIFLLDPELAHSIVIKFLKLGLFVPEKINNDPILKTDLWGKTFLSPLGLAAGFDKNAEAVPAMLGQGFGFVEVGSITPKKQKGNVKPRLFRLVNDRAVINRMGFNNDGHRTILTRIKKFRQRKVQGLIGINLGKNKNGQDPFSDYVEGIRLFAEYADYLVINISSPNTPGVRALQEKENLDRLLSHAKNALSEIADQCRPPPLLLKISPDLTDSEKADIIEVVLKHQVDGVIATNTTVSRPSSLQNRFQPEAGGLSGKPLFEQSTKLLGDFYKLTNGKVPLIGVGGISSGADAYEKIRAGASLVQLYSALIYDGPKITCRINRELADFLRKDGFTNVSQAVGSG